MSITEAVRAEALAFASTNWSIDKTPREFMEKLKQHLRKAHGATALEGSENDLRRLYRLVLNEAFPPMQDALIDEFATTPEFMPSRPFAHGSFERPTSTVSD